MQSHDNNKEFHAFTHAYHEDEKAFYAIMRAFEADIASIGVNLGMDAQARLMYAEKIKEMSKEIALQAKSGTITWADAAKKAQEARNNIMNIIRKRTTPTGVSYAEKEKLTGKTLRELIIKKTAEMERGGSVNFKNLSPVEQKRIYARYERLPNPDKNKIYAEIVKSSGEARAIKIMGIDLQRMGPAARSLVVISLALSVYNVAMAENKTKAVAREASITAASIGGGFLSGAVAAATVAPLCGPAAPICVTVGAFIGGTLAAFGVSWLW